MQNRMNLNTALSNATLDVDRFAGNSLTFSSSCISQSAALSETMKPRLRTYICRFCGKNVKRLSTLQFHERSHTGHRPFACRFCWKSFGQASDRRKHERIHTGERPYSCLFCQKSFSDSSNLRKHERLHKPSCWQRSCFLFSFRFVGCFLHFCISSRSVITMRISAGIWQWHMWSYDALYIFHAGMFSPLPVPSFNDLTLWLYFLYGWGHFFIFLLFFCISF